MRLFLTLLFLAVLNCFSVSANDGAGGFTLRKVVAHSPVISQGSTGTCWSFTATSFLESEIMRKGFPETDLSEMFFVYHTYLNKAEKYLLYHGNNNFGQGGQAHDVMDVLRVHGMVTNDAFPGKMEDGRFQHRALAKTMLNKVERLNDNQNKFDVEDVEKLNSVLEKHLGKLPKKVKTADGRFSPVKYREEFDIDPDDFVELTSYSHHPFYQPFVLEVPDNWSHALYYNLPIDELVQVMVSALENDYTVCWDGDTSEKTFMHNKGIADLPEKQQGKVTQKLRQKTFYNRTTTDDHLMHIVGLSEGENGKTGFYTKNSWGAESNEFGGYLNLTEDYVRLKTVAIMVHKNAIPRRIRQKLDL
ncbi:bleomycin hydrolase [Mariniphaga anaerophila]|uniref:Aminopeptidase n=1 Tax=Mariniphaga anaerophila TaxID=1484053 RepID=A0A1M5BG82_9BACT|nr:C1 family peptidase [Mariniphaga anaerophila]SHF41435.1 bleomycin hydrolase [Mariniphaga anaerophila]